MEIILGIAIYLIGVVVAMAMIAWFNVKDFGIDCSPACSLFSWLWVLLELILLLVPVIINLIIWLDDVMRKPYQWFYDKFNK